MKFSLITTFFNTGKYLDRLYNSILQQTYSNWEWIITDNGSTDDTKEKLLELSKKDKRVIYKEQHHQFEMYFNPQKFGDGDFIFQIDSDDMLIPKTLEIYLYFFTLLPEVILIIGCVNQFEDPDIRSLFDITDINKIKNLLTSNIAPLSRCWRNIDVTFEEGKLFHNDFIQVTRLEELGKFLYLPRTVYKWNYRADSISHSIYSYKVLKDEENRMTNSIIERRNNEDLDTHLDIFKGIDINYYNTIQISNLNYEKECKYISFIKKDNYSLLEEKLKLLYYDHKVYINEYENIDYFFTYINNNQEDYDFFLESFKKFEKGEFVIKSTLKKFGNILNDIRDNPSFVYQTFIQNMETFIVINR